MISFAAVQKASVERWKGFPSLAAIIGGRVYDGLEPEGSEYPLLRVGQKTEVPTLQYLGGNGWSNTIVGHAFSRYLGDGEIAAIVEQMDAAVAEPLVLDGYGTATLRRELLTTLEEEGGKLRHANVRYRITTHAA